MKRDTLCVQGGWSPKKGEPRQVPIYASTTFKYETTQQMGDLFDLKASGYFYTRLANPTNDQVAKKIAALEGGVAAILTSSGQAASTFAVLNICNAGDHVVSSAQIYGGTFNLFAVSLKKLGIEFTFVDPDASPAEIQKAFRPNTKCVFGETVANPSGVVLDIAKFAKIAHKNGVPLIIDNTFPTPYLCNPFDYGCDIVTHSTTKYLDGHATSVGGIVVEKGDFDWAGSGKFPEFTEPDASYHGLIYTRDFPAAPFSVKMRVQLVRDYGIPMMPFNAFLTMLGTETLPLRMERHSDNALKMAQFLKNHPKVSWVNYPGLEDNPEHAKLKKYMRGGSGVLCFGVKGGKAAGEKVMNALKLAAIVVHVADIRTCVLHPASMTHRQLSESELVAAGVTPDLIRLSVGIENIDDIIADFDQALNQA